MERDAVVVGSGPNGLAAAWTLAAAGLDVELLEGASTFGGGTRSAELTLPGVVHDVCSAAHPLAAAAPFFAPGGGPDGRGFDLAAHGVRLLQPEVPLWLQPYLPIAVIAALDAVFGAVRAVLDGIFNDKVFVVSFLSNVVVAGFIVFLGDQLGVGSQLSTGVVVVLGVV